MNLFICTLHPLGEKKRGVSDQIICVMRLIVVLTILCCFKVSASVYAQKISIDVSDVPIETVFDQIKKQSGYTFWYKDNVLEAAKRVTVKLKDFELKAALEACLKDQPLSYEISGKIIVIRPKVAVKKVVPGFKALEIRGKVLDEKGVGLAGVTVRLKGSDKRTMSGDGGEFVIEVPDVGSVLVFSFVGYEALEYVVNDGAAVSVALKQGTAQLQEVGIVSTGYQKIPKERATGSFVVLDSALINRRISTNILDRLDGITSGLLFNGSSNLDIPLNLPGDRLGINIRGESSLLSSKDPLIVVDNFPYSGEIKNINPNDIESITILKDAAAASIWGARSGNGVIVITTKKGNLNSKMKISFNSNLTFNPKPDLYNVQNVISTNDYVGLEQYLFEKGLFNQDLLNFTAQTPVSPVVEILDQQRKGLIGNDEVQNKLNYYRSLDVRKDFEKYVYQTGIKQQYYLGLRGGTNNLSYSLSAGLDKNQDQIKRNGYNRTTINSFSTYTPVKNLEISFGLNYSKNKTELNNTRNTYGNYLYSVGGRYTKMLPYTRLADDYGVPSPMLKGLKTQYIEQLIATGYKDWYYRPLEEIANGNNEISINNVLIRTGIKYKFLDFLDADLQYASEYQDHSNPTIQNQNSYFARNLMNRFAQRDPLTGKISYIFPEGGIYSENHAKWKNDNFRGQLNFEKGIGKHLITAMTGFEIREQKVVSSQMTLYGYDDQFGTSVGNIDYKSFYPTLPSGSSSIPLPSTSMNEVLERYVSYYANLSYIYDDKYQFTLSGRKDGSNIFGVNTNKKITPLMSAGLGWVASNEPFFTLGYLSYLKLRASYGYNGNLRNTSAYLSGFYANDPITGFKYISVFTPPNPELRWEKVRNINLGLDFAIQNNRVSGTIEYYMKRGMDLLQYTPLAGQTGFSSYTSNAAEMRTKGLDLTFNSINLNKSFKWNTSLLLSSMKDKVLAYDPKPNATIVSGGTPIVGYPLNSIFSYKWAGLDPQTGDPLGILNGSSSKDYAGIANNFNPDSLIFNGNARPQIFGSIRNDFSYKGFNMSFNIVYKFDYFIRRSSVSLNYTDLLGLYQHIDYSKRWQQPGDESWTTVPSLVYPSNSRRNNFYKGSEILVEPADHIRLQDIRFGYELPESLLRKAGFKRIEIYSYAQNLGILWRKNKLNIDPDIAGVTGGGLILDLKIPTNISFGIIADF